MGLLSTEVGDHSGIVGTAGFLLWSRALALSLVFSLAFNLASSLGYNLEFILVTI